MESQFAFTSRDDLWHLQNEMKSVIATQAEHTERLLRLERRQDEEIRMKSVWGNTSPFPSILGGTPQQDPGYNPAAEAFKNFDQDQSNSLLGSLHLETEDEPRRGASRANSVRFDEAALHGHFGHGSRSSSEFFPLRNGSGLGGHLLTERSASHRSEGRQSATSQSNLASRLNSLGFEGRQSALTPVTPNGPPPGLFHLGPLPSIIRCWLNTDFSNESLLYAAICTGSYRSTLARSLVSSLELENHVTLTDGEPRIKMQVYLPEAMIQQTSSLPSSPAPQLPALTVDFYVQDMPAKEPLIQIIIGSDVLRARNGDILFSQDRLTIFDDERNKLVIPIVRPENTVVYQGLVTVNSAQSSVIDGPTPRTVSHLHPATTNRQSVTKENLFNVGSTPSLLRSEVHPKVFKASGSPYPSKITSSNQPSVIGEGRASIARQQIGRSDSPTQSENHTNEYESIIEGTAPDTPGRGDTGNTWGSWRRDSTQSNRPDSSFSSVASNSGYQRPGRVRGMKVLKPARSTVPSRSTSTTQATFGIEYATARSTENPARPVQYSAPESTDSQPPGSVQTLFSSEAKSPLQPLTNKVRPANPVGGASAFGWLNNSQQKEPSASME
ncbi:hypothetical protein MMC13_006869 [Lambiella insularis]|nr:hypothetical protein [Lambiella insularis]